MQIQIDSFGSDRVYGCELDATANYAEAVAGLGVYAATIRADDDLDAALTTAIEQDGPACLNILIDSYAAPKFVPLKI